MKLPAHPVSTALQRHSPRGGCGLKSEQGSKGFRLLGHSPRGGCGLKLYRMEQYGGSWQSLSARRVWIEILTEAKKIVEAFVTLREEGVD